MTEETFTLKEIEDAVLCVADSIPHIKQVTFTKMVTDKLTTPKFAEGQVVKAKTADAIAVYKTKVNSPVKWERYRPLDQNEVGVKNWVPRAEFDKLREAYTGTLCLIGNRVWKSAEDQAFINSICEDGSATLDAIPEDLK